MKNKKENKDEKKGYAKAVRKLKKKLKENQYNKKEHGKYDEWDAGYDACISMIRQEFDLE